MRWWRRRIGEPGIGWVGRTGDVRPVVRADYLQQALTELREA